eukprot:GFUD01034956.1.p1 GENE.GFUD01034956.1~~GFUD01034956.1.p1  ORF type:complete len:391 (+),score=143.52 GFUD01034956.1:65-1237(+)
MDRRSAVHRNVFVSENDLKVSIGQTDDMYGDMEEGELSEDETDTAADMSSRVVTRPDNPDLLNNITFMGRRIEVDKKNPWGGVAKSWTAGSRKGREVDLESGREVDLESRRVSVKDRLGWRRRETMDTYQGRGMEMDWKIKMKRPRMEMVADMEEMRVPAKKRLSWVNNNMGQRQMKAAQSQVMNRQFYRTEIREEEVHVGGREALHMKVERPSLNYMENAGRTVNVGKERIEEEGVKTYLPDKFRERQDRTVGVGPAVGVTDARIKRGGDVDSRKEVMKTNPAKKDNEDSLEVDNGSDLNDEESRILIQVTQSGCESSDESEKFKEAVMKIEKAKKKEAAKRINLKIKKDKLAEKNERGKRARMDMDKKKRDSMKREKIKEETLKKEKE